MDLHFNPIGDSALYVELDGRAIALVYRLSAEVAKGWELEEAGDIWWIVFTADANDHGRLCETFYANPTAEERGIEMLTVMQIAKRVVPAILGDEPSLAPQVAA